MENTRIHSENKCYEGISDRDPLIASPAYLQDSFFTKASGSLSPEEKRMINFKKNQLKVNKFKYSCLGVSVASVIGCVGLAITATLVSVMEVTPNALFAHSIPLSVSLSLMIPTLSITVAAMIVSLILIAMRFVKKSRIILREIDAIVNKKLDNIV